MTNSISIENISFKYENSNSDELIFKDFSKNFHEANSYGIFGKNGCGKSTLLKLIAGYILPHSGTIDYHFAGERYNHKNLYKILSFTAPYINYLSQLSPAENYKMLAKLNAQKIDESKLAIFLEKLSIKQFLDKKVSELSTGTVNKYKLIQHFIFDKKIIILDEPFENLDIESIETAKAIIRQEQKDKIILLSSHYKEHLEICSEIHCF